MKIPFMLAIKGIMARPRQYLLCTTGVFLGVLSLTLILSVSNGFEKGLVNSILETTGHISLSSPVHIIPNWHSVNENISKMDEVASICPAIMGQAIIEHGKAFSGVNIKGVLLDNEDEISQMAGKMTSGVFDFHTSNEALMGANLASQLGLAVGDTFKLLCPDGDSYDIYLQGTFEMGVAHYDLQTILVPLRFAQRLFGFGQGVSHILVNVKEPLEAMTTAKKIGSETGLVAVSWLSSNKVLLSALSMEKRVMFLVLLLSLVVAGFGISNVLTMTVYERYRDIGILRAIGVSRSQVMKIFLLQGFFVGVAGVIAGSLGGYFVGILLDTYPVAIPGHIYYVDKIPVDFLARDFILIGFIACLVATFAGLFPAKKAVSVNPWEAIRYYQ